MERWTPRSLQLDPPAVTPAAVSRHRPTARTVPTTTAARPATMSAPRAGRKAWGGGGRSPRHAATTIGMARIAAAANTTPRPYPPARWLSQYTRWVASATEPTMARPRRPAPSIRGRSAATTAHPGTTSTSGQTIATASNGTIHATPRLTPMARTAAVARRLGMLTAADDTRRA